MYRYYDGGKKYYFWLLLNGLRILTAPGKKKIGQQIYITNYFINHKH